MKKFIDPIPDGGAPMFSDTVIAPLFKDIYAAIEGSLYGIAAETQGVIVKGCVVTPNGGNFDCTSGVVYLNGQFMDFAGFTNQAATRYIVAAAPVNSPFPFFDGGTKNLIVTQSATHQSGVPGGGAQYIAVANVNPRRLSNYISPAVQDSINDEVFLRENADAVLQDSINDEVFLRENADAVLQNNINAEATTRGSADTTLQNQITALGINDYTATTAGAGALETIATLPRTANKTTKYLIEIVSRRVSGGDAAGTGSGQIKSVVVTDVAGTGTVQTPTIIENYLGSANAGAVSIALSGTNTLVQIQSGSSHTYACRVTVKIKEM